MRRVLVAFSLRCRAALTPRGRGLWTRVGGGPGRTRTVPGLGLTAGLVRRTLLATAAALAWLKDLNCTSRRIPCDDDSAGEPWRDFHIRPSSTIAGFRHGSRLETGIHIPSRPRTAAPAPRAGSSSGRPRTMRWTRASRAAW